MARFQPSDQIKRQLYRCILEGRYQPGKPLPTILDLSKQLRVSTKTVQKAIHALREEGVIETKRGVGMFLTTPNQNASRGKRVGLVHTNKPSYLEGKPYPGNVVAALQEGLDKEGYTLVPFSLDKMERLTVTDELHKKKLCGLILLEVDSDPLVLEFREMRLPLVSLDYDAYRHGVPSVIFDNIQGTFAATKHLLGAGHRKIVFIRPLLKNPINYSRSLDYTDDERVKGYRVAMVEAGLPVDVRECEFTRGEMQAMLVQLFGRRPAPTALVFTGDFVAAQVAVECRRLGFAVPGDLSMIGFGNSGREIAEGVKLTSVEIDATGMGREGAKLFLEALAGGQPRREILPVKLHLRDSVAAPRPERVAVMAE